MLEILYDWLEKSSPPVEDAEDYLARLAKFYGAEGIGLLAPVGGKCPVEVAWWQGGRRPGEIVFPWIVDERFYLSNDNNSVISRVDGEKTWLISLIGNSGAPYALLWVLVPASRPPSARDCSLLPLAGNALLQGLTRTHLLHRAMQQSRLQEDLERSARLAAKLAHDFGNLLTGILGFADLTLLQTPPGSSGHQFVSEVCNSAKEGADWVRKLQVFSRRNSRNESPGDLAQVISLEESRTRTEWQGQASLVARMPRDLSAVAVDSATLHTAVMELLENARQAQGNQGTVALSVRETTLDASDCAVLLGQPAPGDYVEVIVADHGPGLPDLVEAGRLDEAFIATRQRLSGLGLAVVYGIVMNCNGGLALSATTGRGSTVKLYLPIFEKESPRPEANSSRIPARTIASR